MKFSLSYQKWVPLEFAVSFCVSLMILLQSCFWLITSKEGVVQVGDLIFPLAKTVSWLGVFPLCLPALLGVVLRLHWQPNWKDRLKTLTWKDTLHRVGGLLLLAVAMNFFSLGPGRVLQWNLLMFLAVSYLLLFSLVRWGQGWLIVVLGAFSLILASTLREMIVGPVWAIPWVGSSAGISYWPIFPWFSVVVFGFVLGHLWAKTQDPQMFLSVAGSVGAILVLFTFSREGFVLALDPANVWGPSLFFPHGEFLIGLFGVVLVLIYGGQLIHHRMWFAPSGWVETFSGGILWVYLIHSVVGVWVGQWLQRPSMKISWTASLFPPALWLLSWAWVRQLRKSFPAD